MAAGFVHGVLNSDNINVTGESFDYGPWRFAPFWEAGFTAAYFDHAGLYAFGRQPEAIYWDVMQLAIALRQITDEEPLIAAMEGFAEVYQREVTAALLWRLGVLPRSAEADRVLAGVLEKALAETLAPIDQFFFDAFGGTLPEEYGEAFDDLRGQLAFYQPRNSRDHAYWAGTPCSMLIDEVETIWASIAESDDWAPLYAKVAAIRQMGEALGIPEKA
jgi:serine/tyrosine/threonine adenylyltransferase